jgi:hypothetical protein
MGNNAELNGHMFCVKKLWVSMHNGFLLYKRGVIKACLCRSVGTGIKIILLRTELRFSEACVREAEYEVAWYIF